MTTLLIRTLRRLRRRPATAAGLGGWSDSDSAPRILDGVDYSLPLMLPRALETTLNAAGKLKAYTEDFARDALKFQFDSPYRDKTDLPIEPVSEDPLREWNWTTRERVLTNTHAAYQRNPIANRACKYTRSFVVGEGFNITYRNRKVKDILDAFINDPDNAVREYERQAPIDLMVDGELFLRFFKGEEATAGQLVMVPQRPWECQYIQTEKGFFRRPVTYRFQRMVSEGDAPTGMETAMEDVPAADILHVAINRHGYELRGRPELYPVLPWLKAYKDWLENRARQNYWRGALLWWVKVTTSAASVVSAVAARWKKPPSPGSVAVTTAAEEVTALTNPVSAGDAEADGRQIKLMSAVGLGLPEYMLADGANANLASSTSQELPALLTFGDYQSILIEQLWYPVLERVIQAALDAGQLTEMVVEEDTEGDDAATDTSKTIRALDAFDVSYAPIQNTDIKNLAEALDIAARNGWVSSETAAVEMGFDYAREQKRMQREAQADAEAMARGEKPMPPGFTPPGYEDGEDGDEEDEEAAPEREAEPETEGVMA